MRKRRAFIRFPETHGSDASLLAFQKELDGLNIKFTATIYSQAGMPAETHIEVFNLNRKDMQFLTTSAATWLEKQSLIQLYAGYDDDVKLIFSGMIMDAIPQGNPDVGLTIKGLSDMQWMTDNVQIKMTDTTIMGLIEKVAELMNYTINIPEELKNDNEWLNKKIDEFSYTGTPMGFLGRVQAMCGGFRLDEKSYMLSVFNNELYLWNAKTRENAPRLLINKHTGMVGYPHPTGYGVNVKLMLNPNIRCGDVIRIESERIPMCNGDYYVSAIRHEGEVRANEWYTTLECSHAKHFMGGALNA